MVPDARPLRIPWWLCATDGLYRLAGKVPVPKGMKVIDGKGKTLLPGLWEMHAHFMQAEWGPTYLAAGVTTARDLGNEFEFITAVRDSIAKGEMLGPQLLLAGLVDGRGPTTFGTNWADTPDEGRAMVAKYKAAGFQQMKIYDLIKPDTLRAITEEAHKQGMSVTGHVPHGMTAMQAVEAGMDQINHLGTVSQAWKAGTPERGDSIFQRAWHRSGSDDGLDGVAGASDEFRDVVI